MTIRIAAGISAILLVPAAMAVASPDNQYRCGPFGDGDYLVSVSTEDPSQASAEYQLGGEHGADNFRQQLIEVSTNSGFRYVGGSIEFNGNETTATLTDAGTTESCVFLGADGVGEATLDASGGGGQINAPGLSLGGKLRNGPGMDFASIGSLAFGTPVTLLEDTGVEMNGYRWFFIQQSNGNTGYQWGGIMCAPESNVAGVFESCQ